MRCGSDVGILKLGFSPRGLDVSSTIGASSTVEERRFSAALEAKMIRGFSSEEPTPLRKTLVLFCGLAVLLEGGSWCQHDGILL